MHDCRKTRDALIDLAFNELPPERKLGLLVEIEDCAECSRQYHELTEALFAVDEAADRAQPGEAYWLAYDAALLDRLRRAHNEQRVERTSLWKQFFAARLRVPVPVAALVVLLLIVSTMLSLRTRESGKATLAPQAHVPAVAEVREVPVVHEKIVTRVVYVERKGRRGRALPEQSTARAARPGLVAREDSELAAPLTRTGLAGFQPADDVKLTIIKAREDKKR
ncbi:MAG TPA: hypothetical protein VM911_23740 [Pyrinomonadaceae bacterium]|jgi:hypothetical protein|nr:hypothetical protein [Pyrinomonadaceae bacterium]